MKIRYADITATRIYPSGYWRLTCFDGYGYYKSRLFVGYTKKEAMRIFHEEVNA